MANSRWLKNDEFRSKIELQKGHLYQLVDMNLCFSCVAMDIWYFSKNLTDYIEHLGKDWIAQSKSNRLVKSKGVWISLKKFGKKMVNKRGFKVVTLGGKRNIKVVLNGKKLDTKRRKLGVIMGDNVQTGINSMTNVGTMIGNNVFIGLGAIVEGEIRPKSKIL